MDNPLSEAIQSLRSFVAERRALNPLPSSASVLSALEAAEHTELVRTLVAASDDGGEASADRDGVSEAVYEWHTIVYTSERGLMVVRDYRLDAQPVRTYVTLAEFEEWLDLQPEDIDLGGTVSAFDQFLAAGEGDPSADELIAEAVSNNPDLYQALLRVRVYGALLPVLAGEVEHKLMLFNGKIFVPVEGYVYMTIS